MVYLGNIHATETESDWSKLFGLGTTNCLKDNCSIEISKFQQNGKRNGRAFILAP